MLQGAKLLKNSDLNVLLFFLRCSAFIVLLLIFLNPSFVPHPPHIFASEFSKHFHPPLMSDKKGKVLSDETLKDRLEFVPRQYHDELKQSTFSRNCYKFLATHTTFSAYLHIMLRAPSLVETSLDSWPKNKLTNRASKRFPPTCRENNI